MNFSSLLDTDLTFIDMPFHSTEQIIEFAAAQFSDKTEIPSEKIQNILMKREKESCTYMGNGLFLPHGRIEEFNDVLIAFIKPQHPLEITHNNKTESIKYVFVILTCPNEAQLYLKTLRSISLIVKQHSECIDAAENADDLIDNIRDLNIELSEYLKAKDFIEKSPAIHLDETLEKALNIMQEHSIDFIPVINKDNAVIGFLELSDIVKASFPEYVFRFSSFSFLNDFEPIKNFWENENKIVINEFVRSDSNMIINEHMSYVELMFRIVKNHYRNMMVIDDNNTYSGLISPHEIINKILRP